jgi:hypothetical protein
VGLERCPFSVVSIIEEILERKNIGSGLENRYYGRRDLLCLHATPSIRQKLELTSPTTCGLSVGIASSRTKATEFVFQITDRGGI